MKITKGQIVNSLAGKWLINDDCSLKLKIAKVEYIPRLRKYFFFIAGEYGLCVHFDDEQVKDLLSNEETSNGYYLGV